MSHAVRNNPKEIRSCRRRKPKKRCSKAQVNRAALDPIARETSNPCHGTERPDIEATHFDEDALLTSQSLRYAEDLVRIYEAERAAREELQRIRQRLKDEIAARCRAEKELRDERQALGTMADKGPQQPCGATEGTGRKTEREKSLEEQISTVPAEEGLPLGT